MDDFISREAVIDSLQDWKGNCMTDAEEWHIRQVIGDIKSLPAADVKPVVRGKWVWDGDTLDWKKRYYCNRCEWKTYDRSDFCPDCGADMREEEGNEHDEIRQRS